MRDELNVLLLAIREAGKAIISLQQDSLFSIKSNNDIVTQADLIANDILKRTLLNHYPDDAWLSEENPDDFARLNRSRVWIVDPIDGTREYVKGIPEYAISAALVDEGVPILAAVFNPATDELFYAIKGQGAFLHQKKITCHQADKDNFLILASRSEYARGEWPLYQKHYHIKQVGSIAYKLALVAAGMATATFSLGYKNEWDVAAGTLLVLEAGGRVTNRLGESLIFNRQEIKVDGIIASSEISYPLVSSLIYGIISDNNDSIKMQGNCHEK